MTSNADIARSMADNMTHSAVPLYGKRLRLPDRGAIIGIIKELRRLFFPAYFGDPQLMALPAENYAALLLERIETALTAQIALALPEDQSFAAAALAREILEQLPGIQQMLMTDIEATFDGDPAAADKEEIIFAYPGLFAIFVYRIAHELYLRRIPMIPRMMTEYAHSRTGIDIHPGAQIGPWFFIDHGTGIVIGET
ncbi:MAG: serine acetyltransferase, partial [Clostridiales bacterium]|nr:serine acetyltransferase [Clostridiales bacterium]